MQSVELYFADTIAKLGDLTASAMALVEEIPSLSPDDVRNRCELLSDMEKRLIQDKEQFFAVIEFVGPSILNTTYIGEFQRALDRSMQVCDELHAALLEYKQKISRSFSS